MRMNPSPRGRFLVAGLLAALATACATTELAPTPQETADREAARIAGEAGSRIEIGSCPGAAAPRVADRAAVAATGLPCPLPAGSDSVRVAILATNDFHGALSPSTPRWAEGDTIGGAVVLAGWIRAVEERYPGATLHLDGGDMMQGTLVSNLTAGRATIEAFEALGVDAAAIGNHEFDWTVDTLRARIAESDFPWLSANTFEKATGERPEWAKPYAWLEAGGLRIAVIGATTTSTPVTTLPAHVEPYEFRDIADTVNELAPRLRAEGADLVIVVAHAGAVPGDEEGEWVGEIAQAAFRMTAPVDLIVSGHTHSHVEALVNGIPIVQARSHGSALGVVTLTWDRAAGRVVDHTLDVWTTGAEGVDRDLEVAALVARYGAAVAEIATRPIATVAEPLSAYPREEEIALGDLIADAQRVATGAQVVIMNPGGIRADLEAGPVTYADVFRIQPFQNTLVRLELTGEQLRRALEHAVDNRVGQVSGSRFAFDPTLPPGERVREATLEDDGAPVVRNGRAVRPDAIYDVVVNNFLATGGDGYATLTEARRATSTGLVDSEVMVLHLSEMPQPVRYEVQGRITRLAPWPPREE
ncbi:MAG TPA: 5'-nucleotidase C-terminal domain-containing protein [Gemmatimonadota bacterium]|nr:5'-nucleotidase C-terminal domain-containing protein [Gemmatimonadota bacterium]